MAASRSGRPVLVMILRLKTDGFVPGGPAIPEIRLNEHRKAQGGHRTVREFHLCHA
jgi:hypothetical protein